MEDPVAEDTTYLGHRTWKKIKLELSWKPTFSGLVFIVLEDSFHRSEFIPGTINLAKSLWLGRSPHKERLLQLFCRWT